MQAMVRTNDAKTCNEGIKVLPEGRTPQSRYFPTIAIEVPVYFIWPDAHPTEEDAMALATISAHMAYLGSSKSPIIAWIEENPPAPTIDPVTETLTMSEDIVVVRVPTAGRLAELEDQFAANLRPRPGHQQLYRWVTAASATRQSKPHPSAFGDMVVLARHSGPAPLPEATLTVTGALRRALLALANPPARDLVSGGIPEVLHGHGPKASPHCAFLALPHIGSPHADGHLLGVAMLFPRTVTAEQRRAVLRVLSGLKHIQTPMGQILVDPMLQPSPDAVHWGLQPDRWRGPGAGVTTWTSVTPVLFDRFPRPSRGGILGAVQALAHNADLPLPVDATVHQVSPLTGVPLASAYRVKRTEEDLPHYVAHLTVRFDQRVSGPILLGAGRFFGLGLFVPYRAGGE